MGLKIIRGSVPPSPKGAMPPLNFFCVLNSGWLGAFTGTLTWLWTLLFSAFNIGTLSVFLACKFLFVPSDTFAVVCIV